MLHFAFIITCGYYYIGFVTEGQNVCPGGKIDVSFFGQNFQFTVSEVTARQVSAQTFQVESESSQSDACVNNLSVSLSDLSVQQSAADSPVWKKAGENSSPGCSNTNFTTSTPTTGNVEDIISGSSHKVSEHETNTNSNSSSIIVTPKRPKTEMDRENFQTPVLSKTNRNLIVKFYKVTSKSQIVIGQDEEALCDREEDEGVRYSDIGGMSKQIDMLKEMISMPLQSPELFHSYGECILQFIFGL